MSKSSQTQKPPSVKQSVDRVLKTLKEADNECTEAPYWLIIDPKIITSRLLPYTDEDGVERDPEPVDEYEAGRIADMIPHCIEGPFFSRANAEAYLKARSYSYSESTYIWCASGYWSEKYKQLCRSLKVGYANKRSQSKGEKGMFETYLPVALVNVEDANDVHQFKSLAHASRYIGKSNSYVGAMMRNRGNRALIKWNGKTFKVVLKNPT